jgi:hypothetical protein
MKFIHYDTAVYLCCQWVIGTNVESKSASGLLAVMVRIETGEGQALVKGYCWVVGGRHLQIKIVCALLPAPVGQGADYSEGDTLPPVAFRGRNAEQAGPPALGNCQACTNWLCPVAGQHEAGEGRDAAQNALISVPLTSREAFYL